jgi:FkbM family methyltransferase
MNIPPLWKVRREIYRGIGKIKFAIMKLRIPQQTILYQGLKVPLTRSGMKSEIVLAMKDEGYEYPEIRGLNRALSSGDRVLELGSGLGIITALAGRAVAPEGKVLSFEANLAMISDTQKFLADHGISNVELRHSVLVPKAETGETRDFHLTRSFASSSLLSNETTKDHGVISVPAVQLNDVVAEFKPNVLVCDIEGGELELIPALDASGLRAVLMELHPDRLSGAQLAEIDAALAAHGLHPNHSSPLGGTVILYERNN